jgi:hypothetical protein
MFVHHAVSRPIFFQTQRAEDRPPAAPTNASALDSIIESFHAISLPLLVFLLLCLAFLEQFRGVVYYQDNQFHEVVTFACHALGYTEVVLCLLTGVAGAYHIWTARQRDTVR